VNGLTLLAMIALAIGVLAAYRAGLMRGRRDARSDAPRPLSAAAGVPDAAAAPVPAPNAAATDTKPAPAFAPEAGPATVEPARNATTLEAERARLVRAYEGEIAALAQRRASDEAERCQLRDFADDRRALLVALSDSRAETARYRQLVVDVENNAPLGFLGGPGSSDDLKLIVGVGPMLERMLHQLGVTTYRQIAHWSERDIDEFDRRLPEFPGRIRRDAWATQARELHHSKYGSSP
jgi:predicted flap endonuclease-1-like 5' DNA nuclease